MKKNYHESIVRKILVSRGFILSTQADEKTNGVDIVAMKDGKAFLIEVKKAKLHNRAWQIDPVSRKQSLLCNTIAIVLPCKTVVFEPMSQHLKLCSKNGVRYITELVNLATTI
jgi:Holliday junction resolvase-like predicted endonuclease